MERKTRATLKTKTRTIYHICRLCIIKHKTAYVGDKSDITNEHESCGFGYQFVRYDGQAKEHVIYRSEVTVGVFINCLECEVYNINNTLANPKVRKIAKIRKRYNQVPHKIINNDREKHQIPSKCYTMLNMFLKSINKEKRHATCCRYNISGRHAEQSMWVISRRCISVLKDV